MIDIAFRAHANTNWTRVVESDVFRIFDARVIVIANAYADGFSVYWPVGSRTILDLFGERWTASNDLEEAMAYVRAEFPTRAQSLARLDDDLGDPSASLLAARIEPTHVDVVWIGPQHLALLRDGLVVARTQPDTLVEQGRAQGFDMRDSPHRHILTRTIRREDILPPHVARFALRPGDRVIAASESVDDAVTGATARDVLDMLPRDKFECVIFAT